MSYSTNSGLTRPITPVFRSRLPTSGAPTPMGLNYYMSFDPGEKTGWASFAEDGALTGNGTLTGGLYALSDFLGSLREPPRVIVTETYRIKDFKFKHHMSTVPTIRLLGVLEEYAYKWNAVFVEQESTAYSTGMRWAGLKVPTGHVKDNESAIGHGVYFLHKHEKKWDITLDD